MTTEEKAKAYDEAIEKARKLENATTEEDTLIEYIFPELAESEDERIRKWIRRELESRYVVGNKVNSIDADKAFVWLEKQKEQKSEHFELKTEVKSPFTGGDVLLLTRKEEVEYRGERVTINRQYYKCVDTGREFTNSKLDEDMMWAVFRAYCEKKGFDSFSDLVLVKDHQTKEGLKQAADKYVESKELVLMSYPPEYIDNVIEDMKIAFMAGAEWRDEK